MGEMSAEFTGRSVLYVFNTWQSTGTSRLQGPQPTFVTYSHLEAIVAPNTK